MLSPIQTLKAVAESAFPVTYAKLSGKFSQDHLDIFDLIRSYGANKNHPEQRENAFDAFVDGVMHKLQDPDFDINSPVYEQGVSGLRTTILHKATYYPELVEFLLTLPQIDPNQKNSNDLTPLMFAIPHTSYRQPIAKADTDRCRESVRLLVNDPRIDLEITRSSEYGITALDMACDTISHSFDKDYHFAVKFPGSMAELLINHGAKIENTDEQTQRLLSLVEEGKPLPQRETLGMGPKN